MAETTETIVIGGTEGAAEAIRQEINGQPGSQSHVTERKRKMVIQPQRNV